MSKFLYNYKVDSVNRTIKGTKVCGLVRNNCRYFIVSPVRGYYGLVVVTPRPQTLHRLLDNFKNPYRIASIFYM